MRQTVMAFIIALWLLPLAAAAGALPSAPYVQVAGQGSLTVVPNMARIAVTVTKTDKDVRLARADVERRARAVLAAARNSGIAERDIKAAGISIAPEYQWQNNSRIFIGQRVSRHIELTLRSLQHYADLIGALVKAGVTTFSTSLDRSDYDVLRQQALTKAVNDAHARAAALAGAAGAKLGPVYSISETGMPPRPQPLMMSAKMASADAVNAEYEPGTMEINVTVNMVYLLKDAQ